MSTATATKLQQIEARAAELFAEYGVSGYTFGWDRAANRRGQCNYTDRRITMSRKIAELATFEESEQTLIHEVAHAVVGPGHGHGPVWKRQARSMGHSGSRTSTRAVEVPKPLIGTCPNGHTSGRHRAPKRPTSCGKCSRSFNLAYLIVWTRNPAA